LLGLGDGTFLEENDYSAGASVLSADFRGDSILDLATIGGNPIYVFLGNGDGTFQPAISTPTNAGEFAAGDLNGDGRPI
jgi:hypothetical protein